MPPQDTVLLILMNAIGAASPLAIKQTLTEIPPLMAGALRFGLISLVLLPFTRWRVGSMGRIAAVALSAGAVPFALLFFALSRPGDISPLAIVLQLNVPFATLLSIIFLGETVRWRRWLGIGLSFLGGAIVAFDPHARTGFDALGLGVLTSMVGAVSIILMRRLKGVRVFHLQAWIAHLSWPFLLGLSLLFEPGQTQAVLQAHWPAWGGVLYVAFASSLIAHAGFYMMLQRYEVSQIAPFMLMSPLFTIGFSHLAFGDQLTPRLLVGAVVTLLGVAIITLRELRLPPLRIWP